MRKDKDAAEQTVPETEREAAPERADAPAEEKKEKSGERVFRLTMASSPHIAGRDQVRTLMRDVIVALMPALIFSSSYFFGPRAAVIAGVSVVSCVIFEVFFCLITRRRQTVGDLSAVVTGLLLAMMLPASVPYWMVIVGDFFAIVVVKGLFGGLGKNFLNPALAGRVFLFSFPALMNSFPAVRSWPGLEWTVDSVSAATPMAYLHEGTLPPLTLEEMFTGVRAGSLGEVSAALLLAGALYLLVRGVIRLRIPLCYLGTVAVLSYCFPPEGLSGTPVSWMLYSLMGGGLILGSFFMATDCVTSPITKGGQAVYGIGCGLLTVFLRTYGSYPEGVAFAILTMNLFSWSLDRIFRTRPYGRKGFQRGRKEGAA